MKISPFPRRLSEISIRGKDNEQKILLEVFQAHNDKLERLIEKGYSRGTLQPYNAARSHLENYLQFTKRRPDIPLREIDYSFISGFEHYLKTEKDCAPITATKYNVNLK